MAGPGRLITIEGIDGAGKTTLAIGLLEALRRRGVDIGLLREPGGVQAAERIRALVKDPDLTVGRRAEALLYAAARAQLVEEAIVPRLSRGTSILLDRFVDSSLAYQGGGRRLGIDRIAALNEFATGGLAPDRTLLLRIDPSVARRRLDRRAAPGERPDRLEQEHDEFFARIDAAYGELARQHPDRILTLDGSGGPDVLLGQALAAIVGLFESSQAQR